MIEQIQINYRDLDEIDNNSVSHVRLISHQAFSKAEGSLPIEFIAANRFERALIQKRFTNKLGSLVYGIRLLRSADKNTTIICNGGSSIGCYIPLLNYLNVFRKRKILLWEAFLESRSRIGRFAKRCIAKGCTVVIVYSRDQVASHARYLNQPVKRFAHIPYKANHSKSEPLSLSIGNYVFSGGNSKRDYKTLFEAVDGTGIPVIVSTTDRQRIQDLQIPENVIIVSAVEPHFARLTAASAFTVVAIEKDQVRGAGETNVCNAMWHGRPVIVADDISACDYVEDGLNGYVVSASAADELREKIECMWKDRSMCGEMGLRAHDSVANNYTHKHFIRRLSRLAAILAIE